MTKEQEAVKRCNKLIETEHSNWIGISNQKAIETVLNMLKEKDNIIEGKECVIETQAHNEEVLLNTLKKKDKMIDLLIDYIDTLSEYYTRAEGKNNEFCDEKCIDKNIDCYDCIKQFFERKAEQSSSINKTQEKN